MILETFEFAADGSAVARGASGDLGIGEAKGLLMKDAASVFLAKVGVGHRRQGLSGV
jgi:hypothetical protein